MLVEVAEEAAAQEVLAGEVEQQVVDSRQRGRRR
jgi:hypothetical protein